MTPVFQLRVAEKAARQIQNASAWWDLNRSAAPDGFRNEIERGFLFISSHPNLGAEVQSERIRNLRRVLLKPISSFLYYEVADEGFVEVLALWHTSRGNEPPF